MFQTIDKQISGLREYAANPKQRIRTGYESLDTLVEGPAAGEVFTFIGRSYTGKSLLATDIMRNHARSSSIFFSLEMTYIQALTRLFAQWADIGAERVRLAVKMNQLPTGLGHMAEEMERHVIVDKSGLNVGDMGRTVEQYVEFFGEKPDFLLIDYLERIGGIKSSAEGWQATEAAADQVKDLAKTYDLPVFLFHQTNRGEPEHTPPTEKSARGGGFTEADFVVGMWAPARDPNMRSAERAELWNVVRMNVLKNRHSGRQNEPWKPLEFERTPSLRFRDLNAMEVRPVENRQSRLEVVT